MIELIPFEHNSTTQNFKVEASFLQKSPLEFLVQFSIMGPIGELICPPPQKPFRLDELWKSTCLEAFLALQNSNYVEINCSPSGHWNAYRFDAYRKGMRPAEHITVRLIRSEQEACKIYFSMNISSEVEMQPHLVGLTLVLETKAQEKSYWALRHPADKADFHLSQGWIPTATR